MPLWLGIHFIAAEKAQRSGIRGSYQASKDSALIEAGALKLVKRQYAAINVPLFNLKA